MTIIAFVIETPSVRAILEHIGEPKRPPVISPARAPRRELGISYNAAWRLKHKLLQAMQERDDSQPLPGNVQLDDVYLGCGLD